MGENAWSLMHSSIPDKLQSLYNDGYKLVRPLFWGKILDIYYKNLADFRTLVLMLSLSNLNLYLFSNAVRMKSYMLHALLFLLYTTGNFHQ